MTTLYSLTEAIVLRMNDGNIPVDRLVSDAEIQRAIVASCASVLRLTSLDVDYNFDGGSQPSGSIIATYENLTVLQRGAKSCRIMLPAQPMKMPEMAGVFAVYPSGREEDAFMYIPAGSIGEWRNLRLVGDINEILFTVEAKWVEVYYDLIGSGITEVDMKLCVVDINTLDLYDPLPISPDQEITVMAQVLMLYGIQTQPTGKEAAAQA